MQTPEGRWEPFEDYVLDFALARRRAGQRVALVTLVEIDGSSPRPRGAQMAVTEAGEWVGYLSGGCIERAVVAEALDAIRVGANRRVRYGRGSRYLDIRLPCGSAIELYFDVMLSLRELEAVDRRVRERKVAFMELAVDPLSPEENRLTRVYHPRPRLIILGVGPAAVCLAQIARTAGLDIMLLSPDAGTRAAAQGIATQPLLSAGHVPHLPADAATAIVLMFHDHEWEGALLPAMLETPAFYIGAMGSRRAHAARLDRLRESGTIEAQLQRIHGPAGLFHRAKSAQAIAVSILAEIMEAAEARAVSSALLSGADPSREGRRTALP